MPRLAPLSAVLAALPLVLAPLTAQTNWFALTPAATPAARAGHGMAFDLGNNQIVMFGGTDGVARQSDTWLLQGSTWTQATPATSPPPRAAHQIAYDPGRGRVVLFGGIGVGTGTLSDTWEWDGSNWTRVIPVTNPAQRRSHPMIYHPARGTVVMWGGYDGSADINDMWEWNGIDWSAINTANRPPARRATDMAYDPVGGGIVLFSGYLQAADTWYFDGLDWVQRTPATSPPTRYDHTMATDLVRGRVVLFGGTATADTWEWNGSNWLQRTPATLPAGRYDHCMVYDPFADRMVMWGGIIGTPDLWEYHNTTPASYRSFGAGCTGSNTLAPRLGAAGRPWIGETLTVVVDQLQASGSFGFLATGYSNTLWNGSVPLPLGLVGFGLPGCQMLADPAVTLLLQQNVNGSVAWNLPIPNQPSLAGIRFFNQFVNLDPGVNAAGATVSNGGDGLTGMR